MTKKFGLDDEYLVRKGRMIKLNDDPRLLLGDLGYENVKSIRVGDMPFKGYDFMMKCGRIDDEWVTYSVNHKDENTYYIDLCISKVEYYFREIPGELYVRVYQ